MSPFRPLSPPRFVTLSGARIYPKLRINELTASYRPVMSTQDLLRAVKSNASSNTTRTKGKGGAGKKAGGGGGVGVRVGRSKKKAPNFGIFANEFIDIAFEVEDLGVINADGEDAYEKRKNKKGDRRRRRRPHPKPAPAPDLVPEVQEMGAGAVPPSGLKGGGDGGGEQKEVRSGEERIDPGC